MAGWLVFWLVGWLFAWLVGPLDGCLAGCVRTPKTQLPPAWVFGVQLATRLVSFGRSCFPWFVLDSLINRFTFLCLPVSSLTLNWSVELYKHSLLGFAYIICFAWVTRLCSTKFYKEIPLLTGWIQKSLLEGFYETAFRKFEIHTHHHHDDCLVDSMVR